MAGRIIGRVMNITAIISRKKPRKRYRNITATNKPQGGKPPISSDVAEGIRLIDIRKPKRKAQEIIRKIMLVVFMVS